MTQASMTNMIAHYETRITNAETRIQNKLTAGKLTDSQASDFESQLQTLAAALQQIDPSAKGVRESLHPLNAQMRAIDKGVTQDAVADKAATWATNRQTALGGMLTKLSDRVAKLVADNGLTGDQNSAVQSDLASLQQQVAAIDPTNPPTGKSLNALYHTIFEEERTIDQDVAANRAAV